MELCFCSLLVDGSTTDWMLLLVMHTHRESRAEHIMESPLYSTRDNIIIGTVVITSDRVVLSVVSSLRCGWTWTDFGDWMVPRSLSFNLRVEVNLHNLLCSADWMSRTSTTGSWIYSDGDGNNICTCWMSVCFLEWKCARFCKLLIWKALSGMFFKFCMNYRYGVNFYVWWYCRVIWSKWGIVV